MTWVGWIWASEGHGAGPGAALSLRVKKETGMMLERATLQGWLKKNRNRKLSFGLNTKRLGGRTR